MTIADLDVGEPIALGKRCLSEETCRKWHYTVGSYAGRTCQVAAYYNADHQPVAYKLRFSDKTFAFVGDPKSALLYGQDLWRDGGKKVVVTEGELDALSVSQVQGNKWPVVSLPKGAQNAKKDLAKQLEWLLRFDEIVLMFDNDAAGKAAIPECAALFPPGRCKVATLPLKDPSDMLVAGRGAEIIDAIWGAKVYRPDGIVTLADLRADVLKEPEPGLPWYLDTLTEMTFGRRYGEVYFLGAGTGVGKTDLLTEQIKYDLTVLKRPVALFFLEQQPTETAKRLAGKFAGKRFHVPGAGWTPEELSAAFDAMSEVPLYLHDHFGTADWDDIKSRIRFLAHSEGVRIFYLDHLTALAASAGDNERIELERIMAEIGGLVKELDIILIGVSHLSTPEGKSHEEGGRVMIRHFKGSRAIGFWCHYMFGLERDQQAEDEDVRHTTTFRVLKDRYTGQATGKTFDLRYDAETGRLFECPAGISTPTNKLTDGEF